MRRYYEFSLVFIVLGLISLFVLQRLNAVRDDMEGATVQLDVVSMQMHLLETIAHRETFGGTLPASENPVDWLPSPPRSYLGGLDQGPAEVSVWYFDRRQKTLVYRFRDGHSAVFKLNRNTRQGENKGVLAGVSLQRQEDRPR
jgi:hypothetical protein